MDDHIFMLWALRIVLGMITVATVAIISAVVILMVAEIRDELRRMNRKDEE